MPKFKSKLESDLAVVADKYSSIALEDRFPFPCLANVTCVNPYDDLSVVVAENKVGNPASHESGGSQENDEEPFDPAVTEEEQCWDDLTLITNVLSEKLREYDELFLSIEGWEHLYLHESILQWIQSARKLLCDSDWENNFEEEVVEHIKDAFCIYPSDQLIEGNKNFVNCTQISPVVLDTLLHAIPVDEKCSDEDDVQERKSSRKESGLQLG